ncbi:ComF family protein [Azospira restricta]|uniref:ComF family protein n=1 Tax=Azospira restricta TaxID=404405 RepID=A0A974SRC7_9RHOO|nr:ComF family protein [Azospira restricta]QRJ65101.1 ComF family protein [Azospira restricta]
MSILAEKAAAIGRRVVDALLPQDCLLCCAPAGGALLCSDCHGELPPLPASRCPRCAQPAPGGEVCGRCQRHPPHFDALLALHPYAFPVDRLIQQLKYGHQLAIAAHFGNALAAACRDLGADLVVPMPLHPQRLAERGFNQALEIARPLARLSGVAFAADACVRQRATVPQEGLSLRQRRRNLRRAFACGTDFGGRHLLLVDDVATTGASVDECARTLKLHGAGRVSVAVVARTLLD